MWWNWTFVNESISELCSSPFWDTNLTWNSANPDFTPCFEKTALAWLPCLFLWFFSPLEIFFLRHSTRSRVSFDRFILLKLVLVALLGTSALIDSVVNYVHLDEKQTPVIVHAPVIKFFTFCLFFKLTYSNARYGIKSSGILFVFSFLLVICGAPQARTEVRSGLFFHLRNATRYEVVDSLLYFVSYISSIAVFILNCFADNRRTAIGTLTSENECPEKDSSVLSRFTFSWISEFVWKGYWKTLDADNLWNVDDDLQTAQLSHRLESNWLRARDEIHQRRHEWERELNETHPLEEGEVHPEWRFNIRTKGPLLGPLWQTFGSYYLYGATFKIFSGCLIFLRPLLLNLILKFTDDRNELLWHGYLYSIALFVYIVCESISTNQHFHITYKIGLQISAALVALIYKKALRMSSRARMKFTVGEIVNLMAVDAQRFKNALYSVSLIWGAPLEFCISLYLLWRILGSSMLVGLLVCSVLLPTNYILLSKIHKLQIKQMERKDERVKLMTEMLTRIKVLKLYAWEPNFQDEIFRIRDREIQVIRKTCYIEVGSSLLYYFSLILLTVISFAVYVLSSKKHVLDARVAFVSYTLFQSFGNSLIHLSNVFSNIVPIIVSVKRIARFLNAEELDPNATTHEPRPEPVVVENATFSWIEYDEASALRNVNLKVDAGKLVAVVGMVGSGKSSLLSAILGDMYKQSGYVNTTGNVAYVPQQAWIRNATLKENITLGVQKENGTLLYGRVVKACALTPDLRILLARDETEIEEKCINLSGGQKQRISLARAVYSEADIYLLDDPLSAVDSHVGKHIFENVIGPNGLLKSKTRILVTHNVTYLPRMDLIIVLKDGTISESGTYEELAQKEGEFASFLAKYVKEESNAHIDKNVTSQKNEETRSSKSSTISTEIEECLSGAESARQRLMEDEETEVGNVGAHVYKSYLNAMGLGFLALTILLNLLHQGLSVGSGFWLSVWSADTASKDDPNRASKEYFYLSVFILLNFGEVLVLGAGGIVLYVSLLRAAKRIHNHLLTAILRWPATAFDRIPLGRIINRLSSDVDIVDNTLSGNVSKFFTTAAKVMSTVFVVCFATPIFIVALVPMVISYYLVQRVFIATSRQLRRLESVSKSPIFSHFEETITGAQSIRAYNLQSKFIRDSENLVDANQKSSYSGFVVNRWLCVRLEFFGGLIAFFASLFAVYARNTLSAGLVGLSITYAIGVSNNLYYWVRAMAEGETNAVAIERIKKYIDVEREAPWTLPKDSSVPREWPQRGEVVFENFCVCYHTRMKQVLEGISFTVNSGEKVGIVGRTGAGKSSLTLSLFRIIESCGGKILIDGIDVAEVGLHTLRKRLTIIPQDPVLFAGTLRMNLDPGDSFPDERLWWALGMVQLKTTLPNADMNLQLQVLEGGSNFRLEKLLDIFNVGQRQLICLARALLRKTKVLILDKATAAVDVETDDLIQATIRREFKDCTVLTIAHRLNTVMDYDRILVLDDGTVIEYDTPTTLLQSKSVFYQMAADAGLESNHRYL